MPTPEVALVSPYPPPDVRHGGHSGVASYTRNLAQALAREGLETEVIAPADPAHGVDDDGPVRVRRVFERSPRGLLRAARAAVATGAPVIHLQHELFLYGGPASVPAFLGALGLMRRHGRRRVVTMHQVVDPSSIDRTFSNVHAPRVPPGLVRFGISGVQRWLPALSDAVIVHENGFAEHVRSSRVVPHGLERASGVAKSDARMQLGLDGRFTLLCFGFVAPYKGIEAAIDAAELLDQDVHLVVGGGPHPRFGQRYLDQLRCRAGTRATFTGFVPDREVPLWFSAADLALFPYPRPHASSGALALALAHGTPFLMSDVLARSLGAPEPTRTAVDPPSLAGAIAGLVADPEKFRSLCASCAGMSTDRTWDDVARIHRGIYEEVVAHADGFAERQLRT